MRVHLQPSLVEHCQPYTLTEPHKIRFSQGVRRLRGAEPRKNHQKLISFLTFHHLSVSKMKPQQRIACSHVGQPQAESRRISYIRHFRRHPPRPNTWPYGLRGRPGHHRNLVAHAAADHFVIGHMMWHMGNLILFARGEKKTLVGLPSVTRGSYMRLQKNRATDATCRIGHWSAWLASWIRNHHASVASSTCCLHFLA